MSKAKRANFTSKQKAALRKFQRKQCCWCGQEFREVNTPKNRRKGTVEHINPLNNGGLDHISNVVMVHDECNLGDRYELGLAISLYIANIRFRPCSSIRDPKVFCLGRPYVFKIMHHDIYVVATPPEPTKEYNKRIRSLTNYLTRPENQHIRMVFVTYEDEIQSFIQYIYALGSVHTGTRPIPDAFKDYKDYQNLVERNLVRRRTKKKPRNRKKPRTDTYNESDYESKNAVDNTPPLVFSNDDDLDDIFGIKNKIVQEDDDLFGLHDNEDEPHQKELTLFDKLKYDVQAYDKTGDVTQNPSKEIALVKNDAIKARALTFTYQKGPPFSLVAGNYSLSSEYPTYSMLENIMSKTSVRRKERKKSLTTKVKKRNALLLIQDHRCLWCWGKFNPKADKLPQGHSERITLEHINPRNNGGSDIIENLGAVHDRCNLHDPYQQGFAVMLYRSNIPFETVKFEDPDGHAGALYVFKIIGHDIFAYCEPANIHRAECIKKKIRIADKHLNTAENKYLGFHLLRNKQDIEGFIQFIKAIEWQLNIKGGFKPHNLEKPFDHFINRNLGTKDLVTHSMMRCESVEEQAVQANIEFYCSGVEYHNDNGTLKEFIDDVMAF